jgi:CO/xanthine dehydrogenase Mo-binding subunit
MAQGQFAMVGKNVRRLDAVEKVTGQAKYTGDFALPGLLEGKALRSPFPMHSSNQSRRIELKV